MDNKIMKNIKLLKRIKYLNKRKLQNLFLKKNKGIDLSMNSRYKLKNKEWYNLIRIEKILPKLKGVILEIKGSPGWKVKAGRSRKDIKVSGLGGNINSQMQIGLTSKRGSYSIKLSRLVNLELK